MVIDAGCYGNDTKSAFENAMEDWGVEYIAVWHQEGGKSPAGNNFNEALNNGGSGNPKYLIRPDKTFKKSPSASEINTAGGNEQHECPTPITNELKPAVNQNVVLYNLNKSGFTINIRENCVLSLSFYSLGGQLVNTFSKTQVSSGIHTYKWENMKLAKGVYLADIYADNIKTTQKVVIE